MASTLFKLTILLPKTEALRQQQIYMKKGYDFLRKMLPLMLFAVVAFCFTACSEDNGDDEPGNNANVVGTWRGAEYDHFYSNVTITFNSDGSGSATIDHSGAYTSIRRAEFTYKVKGNKVTTKGVLGSANSDGETDTQDFNNTYEVSGNTLYVKSGNGWYTGVVQSYTKLLLSAKL